MSGHALAGTICSGFMLAHLKAPIMVVLSALPHETEPHVDAGGALLLEHLLM